MLAWPARHLLKRHHHVLQVHVHVHVCGLFFNVCIPSWYTYIHLQIYTRVSNHTYCVYRDCHGWSSIIAIHKDINSFHFQFQFNLTSNDIKVENMSKSNCMQKIVYPTRYEIHVKHDFHRFFIFFFFIFFFFIFFFIFFSRIASVRYTEIYFKNWKFLRGHIPSFNQGRLHFR